MVLKHRNDPTKLKEEIKEVNKVYMKKDIVNNDDNSRGSDFCKMAVHRASYAKYIRSRSQLKIEEQF